MMARSKEPVSVCTNKEKEQQIVEVITSLQPRERDTKRDSRHPNENNQSRPQRANEGDKERQREGARKERQTETDIETGTGRDTERERDIETGTRRDTERETDIETGKSICFCCSQRPVFISYVDVMLLSWDVCGLPVSLTQIL